MPSPCAPAPLLRLHQEPLSILALESICDTALRNVKELHDMHSRRSSGSSGSNAAAEGAGTRTASAQQLVVLATAAGAGVPPFPLLPARPDPMSAASLAGALDGAGGMEEEEGLAEEEGLPLAVSNARMAGDLAVDGAGRRPLSPRA